MIKGVTFRFNFRKLVNKFGKKKVLSDNQRLGLARVFASASRKVISSQQFSDKVKDSTLEIRKNLKKRKNSDTLWDTGALHNSIVATSKGITMNDYGRYQNDGWTMMPNSFTERWNIPAPQRVMARPFIITDSEVSDDVLDSIADDIINIITTK